MGLNKYSLLSSTEFKQYYNIVKDPQNCSATKRDKAVRSSDTAPDFWDWRDHDGVTPVKDQGNCGSCWTFSTVGAVESHFQIGFGQFRNLSEQQLVDCAGDFDTFGCNGGLPSYAF